MAELKSLTIGGNTYDSFVDQTARNGMFVMYNQDQGLLEEQKAQARANIGAAAIGESGGGVITEQTEDIAIETTTGKFAKWTTGEAFGGAESSVSWAEHSQFIPVVPGETLRISCRSANACPGVVFYSTNTMSATNGVGYALENPGTGDPLTGSVNRYTYNDEDVIVPDGAAYAILNHADGTTNYVWKCQKVTFVSGGNGNIEELEEKLANAEYENEQLMRRITNAEKNNDFTWGAFDKSYFVFVHDDSREFITTAYNAFHAKGVPVSAAAIAPYLSNTHNGKTVKEWLDLIVADGGEVLCHYSYDLHESDDDSVWYEYVVDAKREFEQNGFNIRGLILAGSSDVNSAKGEKFCRRYFDYADKVGTSTRYNLGRKLMLTFDGLDAFKARIDMNAQTPGIYAYGFHGNRDDETWITEDSLKEIIDYISAKDNCEITTYSAVFDSIGTTVLEKRIDESQDDVNALAGAKITRPNTAEVGQTIVVKSVDSYDKPTAWEAVDLPSGGSGVLFADFVKHDSEDRYVCVTHTNYELCQHMKNGTLVVARMFYNEEDVLLYVYHCTFVSNYFSESGYDEVWIDKNWVHVEDNDSYYVDRNENNKTPGNELWLVL